MMKNICWDNAVRFLFVPKEMAIKNPRKSRKGRLKSACVNSKTVYMTVEIFYCYLMFSFVPSGL